MPPLSPRGTISMTLILTIANKNGIHQWSDFALTDPRTGRPVADSAGTKQLKATFNQLAVGLAFTGIAKIGTRNTIDWLANELKALSPQSKLQDVCEALERRCTSEIGKLGASALLTIVVAACEIGAPCRVATISNADWGKNPPVAKSKFEIQIHLISKPFRLISGYREPVPQRDRQRLKAIARASSTDITEIQDALVEINATAAQGSSGWISTNCWVESLWLDSQIVRSQSRNVGEREGFIRSLLGGIDLSEMIHRDFRAAPGQKLRLTQQVGVIAGPGGLKILPPPQGEPRKFAFSGGSSTANLLTPDRERCATLTLTRLYSPVEARLNEEVIVPFAEVQIANLQIDKAFAKPLYPWPYLSPDLFLDGVAVPQGIHHSIGHWIDIDGGALNISFPQVSTGVRKIALTDNDEIILAINALDLVLAREQRMITATLDARIRWRVRMDGTSG